MGISWKKTGAQRDPALPGNPGAACVIEANDLERAGVSSLLRHLGFTTHETGSADIALLIAEETSLSLVVVNVGGLDLPADTLVRRLRAQAPAAVLIALTADLGPVALANLAGADAVLASPACGEALCSTIAERLSLQLHPSMTGASPDRHTTAVRR